MINGQINDGPDPENIPLQAGKGFADSSRALAYQLQVQSKKTQNSKLVVYQKHFTFYGAHFIL